jgi:hypothetical protein
MSENSYSVFNAMTDIVASPAKALDEVKSHTSWLWWPLLTSVFLAAGLFFYYYNWVDFPWLVEETIRQTPPERRAESADAIRKFMSVNTTMMTTIAAIVIMTMLIYTIQAAYLHLANKLTTGAEISFGQWFSLASWSSFVGVFGTIAAFVVIFMADSNQLAQTDLQPLSLNSLLLHASPGTPWFTWASSLSLINIWMIYLLCTGYSRWTGSGAAKSLIIAALPYLLIFGIWALMI